MNQHQELFNLLIELDDFLSVAHASKPDPKALSEWWERFRKVQPFDGEPMLSALVRHVMIAINRIRRSESEDVRRMAIFGAVSLIDIGMGHLRSAPHNCSEAA